MLEQGTLHQQTVRTVQCTGVPAIFGPSEPAQDGVSLHNVQNLCITLYRTCNMCLGSKHLLLLYDRQCLTQTVSDVADALVIKPALLFANVTNVCYCSCICLHLIQKYLLTFSSNSRQIDQTQRYAVIAGDKALFCSRWCWIWNVGSCASVMTAQHRGHALPTV